MPPAVERGVLRTPNSSECWPIGQPSLRVRIARSYWRWIFRHSTKTIFNNVTIGVLWPTAQDLVALERVKEALNLLAQYAPLALRRLAGLVDGILIFPVGQRVVTCAGPASSSSG